MACGGSDCDLIGSEPPPPFLIDLSEDGIEIIGNIFEFSNNSF